jgi:hypothetical protein
MRLRNWRPLATLSAGMMLWASATAPLAAQATATQPSATAWTPEVMMTIRRVSAV